MPDGEAAVHTTDAQAWQSIRGTLLHMLQVSEFGTFRCESRGCWRGAPPSKSERCSSCTCFVFKNMWTICKIWMQNWHSNHSTKPSQRQPLNTSQHSTRSSSNSSRRENDDLAIMVEASGSSNLTKITASSLPVTNLKVTRQYSSMQIQCNSCDRVLVRDHQHGKHRTDTDIATMSNRTYLACCLASGTSPGMAFTKNLQGDK